MLAPSQEENTNPNETRFVSHTDVSLAYTPVRQPGITDCEQTPSMSSTDHLI
jgi:hypothetical protein